MIRDIQNKTIHKPHFFILIAIASLATLMVGFFDQHVAFSTLFFMSLFAILSIAVYYLLITKQSPSHVRNP